MNYQFSKSFRQQNHTRRKLIWERFRKICVYLGKFNIILVEFETIFHFYWITDWFEPESFEVKYPKNKKYLSASIKKWLKWSIWSLKVQRSCPGSERKCFVIFLNKIVFTQLHLKISSNASMSPFYATCQVKLT